MSSKIIIYNTASAAGPYITHEVGTLKMPFWAHPLCHY